MFSPTEPDQPTTTTNPLKQLFATVFSYDGNVMLAALVSLLLVILFVLLLHIYAKWFLSQALRRRRTSITAVSRHNRFHTFNLDSTVPNFSTNISTSKGLDSSTISTIPLFVYKTEEIQNPDYKNGVLEMDCVICLTPFEDGDVGRNLPKCGHCFHVECIDMWLGSHVNCPICRAPLAMIPDGNRKSGTNSAADRVPGEDDSVVINVSDSGFGENDCADQVGAMSTESESMTSSSSSPVMVGCSLKRMLSRNRPEGKVFPSSHGNDPLGG